MSHSNNFFFTVPDELQTRYKEYIFELFKKRMNIVYMFSAILIPSAFIFDILIFPVRWKSIFMVRIISTVFCLILYYLSNFTRLKNSPSLMCHILNIIVCLTIVHLCYMTGKYASIYYAGLILIFICIAMVLPWNIKNATIAGFTVLTMFIVYNLLPPLLSNEIIQWNLFWNSIYFLFFSLVMGIISSGVMENYRREIFTINEQESLIKKQLVLKKNELEEANKQLKISEQTKKDFIANISHDLKTPVSIISAHVDSIRRYLPTEIKVQNYIDFIDDSCQNIIRFIDKLISITLLDSETDKPVLKLYDYPQFLSHFCKKFIQLAEQNNINLKIEIPDYRVIVQADSSWLQRIMGNLITNAFKFTKEGGITVKSYVSAGSIFTEVIDTGSGIEQENKEIVFERKFQTEEGKKAKGTGLGLSITKQMVETLGGNISVESKLGKGTKFYFNLPLYLDQNATVENNKYDGPNRRVSDRRKKENRRSNYQISLFKNEIEQVSKNKNFHFSVADFENLLPNMPTILIVEDTPGQIHVIIEALKKHYNLIFAMNGVQGLQKLKDKNNSVDLILSDVKMPEMDGIEFCKNVFAQGEYKHIPFIFITAFHNTDEQLKGLSFGATDYLPKPFNARILLEKLNHWISRREYEKYLIQFTEILEHKNRSLTKLRSIINHEVKNPLMAVSYVKRGLDQLKEKFYDASDEKNRETWDRLSYLDTTMKTISDVLETSKIIEQEFNDGELKEIPVNSLLDEAIIQTEHLMNGVSLIHDKDGAPHDKIPCDHRMITQIFVNLIRNAVDAIREKQPEGGTICISYMILGKNVNINIKDDGIGMTREHKNNLFTYQFTTKRDGTGIGLYLSQKMIKVLGGDIAVSTEKDIGSEFVVCLPLAKTID